MILQYCGALRESELNQKAVLVALHKALQLGDLDTAEGLLRALPEHGFAVRPHYFWPLIIAAKRTQSVPGEIRWRWRVEEWGGVERGRNGMEWTMDTGQGRGTAISDSRLTLAHARPVQPSDTPSHPTPPHPDPALTPDRTCPPRDASSSRAHSSRVNTC